MWDYPPGATLIDADEANGLIPQHITTQRQLNEWEQNNILMTEQWVSNQRFEIANIATSEFVKQIHVKMFNKTWRWAGQFRKTNKNIGVDWPLVSVELKILLDDVQYQAENNIYPKDELAARFHHRLVAIHPFPNGNGRHARMMADIMLIALGCSRFSWGSNSLAESSPVRKLYIEALREADRMNYEKLITFVRD
jgi:Fic-DOC domain mobile mystery protein B